MAGDASSDSRLRDQGGDLYNVRRRPRPSICRLKIKNNGRGRPFYIFDRRSESPCDRSARRCSDDFSDVKLTRNSAIFPMRATCSDGRFHGEGWPPCRPILLLVMETKRSQFFGLAAALAAAATNPRN